MLACDATSSGGGEKAATEHSAAGPSESADPKADPEADAAPEAAPPAPALAATRDVTDASAQASAFWKYWGADQPDLAAAKILVTGDSARRAVAFGALTITEAKTDTGEALALYSGMRPDKDLRTSVEYRDLGYPGTKAEGVEFEVPFDHPTKDAKAFASLKGTIAMRIFGNEDALELGDVDGFVGKSVDAPALKAAGVELAATWDDEHRRLDLEQTGGALGQVGNVELVTPDGEAATTERSTDLSGPLPTFGLRVRERDVLKTARLRLTVYSELEVVRAPFALSNVEIAKP